MKRRRRSFARRAGVAALPWMAGCAIYSSEPIGVTVVDAETSGPVAGATVRVSYRQPPRAKLNIPAPAVVVTDESGHAVIEVTDFESGALWEASADGYLDYLAVAPAPQRIPDAFRYEPSPGAHGYEAGIAMFRQPAPMVEVRVPGGFRGPLGIQLAPPAPMTVGQRVFVYDASDAGLVVMPAPPLLLRDLRWTSFETREASAGVIPAQPDLGASDTTVAVRRVTPVPGGTVWVVGTARDQAFVRALLDPWRDPDGGYSRFNFSVWPQIVSRWSAARAP